MALSLPGAQPGRPPNRDDLLALSNSFLQRLKIRFKWMTIRSYRRFRADDYSAFLSFGVLGTLGWFLLGTTSFFAFAFFVVNSLSSQNWLAGKLGDYLTASTGMTVVFESAIVPKWGVTGGGSKIVFRNVYISRGPVKGELGVLPVEDDGREETEEQAALREMVAKWTHFHLSIDSVEVGLSLRRWLDGKGLVREATIKGTRGVIERSHIQADPDAEIDRMAYRNKPRPGDFELESLQVEDFLVTIYQPDHFRPYTFSVFNADIRRFRKQWLFYDLLSAESVTGQCDNCLFSLHKPQSIGRTSEQDLKDAHWARMSRFRVDGVPIDHMQSANDDGVMSWITSGRCDLVADIRFPRDESELDLGAIVADLVDTIDQQLGSHLAGEQDRDRDRDRDRGARIPGRQPMSRGALEAPKGWRDNQAAAHAGADSERTPSEMEKKRHQINGLRDGLREWLRKDAEESGETPGGLRQRARETVREWLKRDETARLEAEAYASPRPAAELGKEKVVSMDLDVRFKDLKATVPYFTSNLSYVNNALVRPIVAFINANKTLIPIRCHIDIPLGEFDGSWTSYDIGILEAMAEQTYAALAHHVQQDSGKNIQAVSLWTLQVAAQNVSHLIKNGLTAHTLGLA